MIAIIVLTNLYSGTFACKSSDQSDKMVVIRLKYDYLPFFLPFSFISIFVRYHEWMKSPELQQLTASEPLTLEQEYDMQRSWREDDDSEGSLIILTQS